MRSFMSVKVEFSDLDGLSWSRSALRKRYHVGLVFLPINVCPGTEVLSQDTDSMRASPSPNPSRLHLNQNHVHHHHVTRSPNSPSAPAFAVLTNADLASFSSEDTIRVSSVSTSSRQIPIHHHDPHNPHNHHHHPHSSHHHPAPQHHKRNSRSRSPVKGLFPGGVPLARERRASCERRVSLERRAPDERKVPVERNLSGDDPFADVDNIHSIISLVDGPGHGDSGTINGNRGRIRGPRSWSPSQTRAQVAPVPTPCPPAPPTLSKLRFPALKPVMKLPIRDYDFSADSDDEELKTPIASRHPPLFSMGSGGMQSQTVC